MNKIVISHEVPQSVKELLASAGTVTEAFTREKLLREISDADAIHGNGGLKVDEELLEAAPKLKMIALSSVGYNNLNIEAMRRHRVLGTHTPGVLNDSVADLTIGLMIAASRRICELDRYMRAGRWNGHEGQGLFGLEVSGKTLGIIGMGRIGQAIAKRAVCGMGMKVLYYNRHVNPAAEKEYGARYVSKEELMSRSDFVVIVTPLTEETRGMVGAQELARMKKTAVLINVARGPVVDEKALIQVLKERRILAAGLDVYEKEPTDPDNELLTLDNVVHVPHIGTATEEVREKMDLLAAENIIACLRGETAPTVVPELQSLRDMGKSV